MCGVNGSTIASYVGTIQFTITDDDNANHTIVLHDVIYLPETAKNLISTSKWSIDRKDDCGVLYRGRYSIFLWDNDSRHMKIDHPPECNTPLMPVNEDDEAYVLFNSTHSSSFPDESSLMPNGVSPTQLTQATDTDKQSADVYSCLVGTSAYCMV